MGASFSIAAEAAFQTLFQPEPPIVLDARRPEVATASGRMMPRARLVGDGDGPMLAGTLDRSRAVIVTCAHGHNRSQRLAAHLRSEGFTAMVLESGYDGWADAGLPTVALSAGGVSLGSAPTVWVTRRRPKIDRVACPWLVSRFLDPRARFLFAEPEWVLDVAAAEGGIAYDLPGGVFEHDGSLCSFDTLLKAFGLAEWEPLARLARIVRGADTDRLDLTPQSAGLLTVSLGLSARHGDDDHAVLTAGFTVYDGLLAWAMGAVDERHDWPRATKELVA